MWRSPFPLFESELSLRPLPHYEKLKSIDKHDMTNATNNFVLLKKSKEGVSKKNKKNVEVDLVVVCINLIWKSAVKKDSLTKM